MTVRPVHAPRWFTVVAPKLPAGRVVLPYPAALGGIQSSMAWQTLAGLSFSMVGGGGPGIAPQRAGPEAPGFEVLARASFPLSPPPLPTASNLAAIRQALTGWGVTTIVVPDQPGFPPMTAGGSVSYAVGLFTAALGRAPIEQASAWVWNDVRNPGSAIPLSPAAFVACTAPGGSQPSGAATAACVLRQCMTTAPTMRLGPVGRTLVAGLFYLMGSLVLWWHVWTGTPSAVMTCGCTDAGRMVWYFRWSAFALQHGHNLLYSTWLFHPAGLNLLADTSAPALALVTDPFTLAFGPVVGVNLAATLIPVVTALSMFWLLQRWVRWTPAAFIGGACYGFSAYVVVQLAFGWLNLACVALLPLLVACLDELLVGQRRRPLAVGAALGLLVAVQFFVSSELVLIAAVAAVIAVVLLVAYAALRNPADLRSRLPHAAKGLVAGAVVAAVLLAYPLWFFVAGPAHLDGTLWSTDVPGALGNAASNFWSHLALWGSIKEQVLVDEAPVLGGYRGPATPAPAFLGVGMLVVLVAGALWWRKDRRLWFFGGLGVITALISLRVGSGQWAPWALVYHLPLFRNVVQSRFAAVVGLCAAVMLAVIVDRTRWGLESWMASKGTVSRGTVSTGTTSKGTVSKESAPAAEGGPESPAIGPETRRRSGWLARLGAVAVAAVALVPVVVVLAPNIPLVVQPVVVPRWFEQTSVHLPPGQVLATYPFATADSQASIPWQAIEGMPYKMAGGGGPAGTVARAGDQKAGFAVLRAASVPLLAAPTLSSSNLVAVRKALAAWGVTTVVVPDDAGLPAYQTARGTAYGVAFFTRPSWARSPTARTAPGCGRASMVGRRLIRWPRPPCPPA